MLRLPSWTTFLAISALSSCGGKIVTGNASGAGDTSGPGGSSSTGAGGQAKVDPSPTGGSGGFVSTTGGAGVGGYAGSFIGAAGTSIGVAGGFVGPGGPIDRCGNAIAIFSQQRTHDLRLRDGPPTRRELVRLQRRHTGVVSRASSRHHHGTVAPRAMARSQPLWLTHLRERVRFVHADLVSGAASASPSPVRPRRSTRASGEVSRSLQRASDR